MADGSHKRAEVILTDEAFAAYFSTSSNHAFEAVDRDLGLLESTPEIGMVYDPVYSAARPPFECRVLYCGYYGIYYVYEKRTHIVTVFSIEDQRKNPENRFQVIDF